MVTVLTTPNCVQCDATKRTLDRKGIPYEVIPVGDTGEGREIANRLGAMSAPVVILENGDWWAGYRPDRISAIQVPVAV